MPIKNLYDEYFQKSKLFLYPLLDIGRTNSITPITTCLSWKDHYEVKDLALMCLYHTRDDAEFRTFEKYKLLGNPLFKSVYEAENDKRVYVFNFSKHKKDWEHVINGQYSKLSVAHKAKIKSYFGVKNSNYVYVDSYLHPERYYDIYSRLLGVKIHILQETVELCSHPDMEKEELNVKIKDLDSKKIIS